MSGERYDGWMCTECGLRHQPDNDKIFSISTFHVGLCGVCNRRTAVTEARDFGYPVIKSSQLEVEG